MILASALLAATAASATPDAEIRAAAERLAPAVVATRRQLHQQPELSNREEKTGRFVADKLRALGIEVRYPVAKTGAVGVLRGGKPGGVVALRSRHGRAADRGDERAAVQEPGEGRDARLRARRAHGDPARRGGGARGAEGAAPGHGRVPVPARRGGRALGRGGRRAADGEGRGARRPEGPGDLRAPRRRLDRRGPGGLDRRPDLRLVGRLHDRGRRQDGPRRAAAHGARPDPGRGGDRERAADDRLAPDRRPPAARADDRAHPGRHALQHHRRQGRPGRDDAHARRRTCARR